jgi:hypothetical protein
MKITGQFRPGFALIKKLRCLGFRLRGIPGPSNGVEESVGIINVELILQMADNLVLPRLHFRPPFLRSVPRFLHPTIFRHVTGRRLAIKKLFLCDLLQNRESAVAHRQHDMREIKISAISDRSRQLCVVERLNQLRHRRKSNFHQLMRRRVQSSVWAVENIALPWLTPLPPILVTQTKDQLANPFLLR